MPPVPRWAVRPLTYWGSDVAINKQQGRKLTAAERQAHHEAIIGAALDLAAEKGYQAVTSDGIARRLGVSASLVRTYAASMRALQRDIMRHAVARGRADVLAQGLAVKDKHALKAPEALRREALELMGRAE